MTEIEKAKFKACLPCLIITTINMQFKRHKFGSNPVPRIMMKQFQKNVKLKEQLEEGTTWEKELFFIFSV